MSLDTFPPQRPISRNYIEYPAEFLARDVDAPDGLSLQAKDGGSVLVDFEYPGAGLDAQGVFRLARCKAHGFSFAN